MLYSVVIFSFTYFGCVWREWLVLRDICTASSSCFLSEVIEFFGYVVLSDSLSLLKQTLDGFICSRAWSVLPGGIMFGESD